MNRTFFNNPQQQKPKTSIPFISLTLFLRKHFYLDPRKRTPITKSDSINNQKIDYGKKIEEKRETSDYLYTRTPLNNVNIDHRFIFFKNIEPFDLWRKKLSTTLFLAIVVHLIFTAINIDLVNADKYEYECSINQFNCRSSPLVNVASKQCIPLSLRCDGFSDCPDSSDEIDCPKNKCTEKEFPCHDNMTCIPQAWICDGGDDCEDGSDELDCEFNCPLYQFKCSNNNRCIEKRAICDGINDCGDGSDEDLLTCMFHRSICGLKEFNCTNGHCVAKSMLCDGQNDCGDNSDETLPECVSCSGNGFKCSTSGQCIARSEVCNGQNDCSDGEDERSCKEALTVRLCSQNDFQCHNRLECINQKFLCDQTADCSDGSDELNCTAVECSTGQFQCWNKVCLPVVMRCNGTPECTDGSDEWNCETSKKTTNTTTVILVHCHDGYRWDNQTQSCHDINECWEDYSLCSGQGCENTDGSFHCRCRTGFHDVKLEDHRFCVRDASNNTDQSSDVSSLIYLMGNKLKMAKLQPNKLETTKQWLKYERFAVHLPEYAVFDYNLVGNYFVITNRDGQFFVDRLNRNRPLGLNISVPNVLVPPGQQQQHRSIQSISIDWLNHLIYFIDKNSSSIQMIKISGLHQRKPMILLENLQSPGDLKVNPVHRWLVYSEESGILRYHLDNSSPDPLMRFDYNRPELLVGSGVGFATSLTLDYLTNRIFWIDNTKHSISSIDFNGLDRRLLLQSSQYIGEAVVLDVFLDNLLWSDLKSSKPNIVFSLNKFALNTTVQEFLQLNESITYLTIVDQTKQPRVETGQKPSLDRCYQSCPYRCWVDHHQSPTTVVKCFCPLNYVLWNSDQCVEERLSRDYGDQYHSTWIVLTRYMYHIVMVVLLVVLLGFILPYCWLAWKLKSRKTSKKFRNRCPSESKSKLKTIANNGESSSQSMLTALVEMPASKKTTKKHSSMLNGSEAIRRDDLSSGYSSILSDTNGLVNKPINDYQDDDGQSTTTQSSSSSPSTSSTQVDSNRSLMK